MFQGLKRTFSGRFSHNGDNKSHNNDSSANLSYQHKNDDNDSHDNNLDPMNSKFHSSSGSSVIEFVDFLKDKHTIRDRNNSSSSSSSGNGSSSSSSGSSGDDEGSSCVDSDIDYDNSSRSDTSKKDKKASQHFVMGLASALLNRRSSHRRPGTGTRRKKKNRKVEGAVRRLSMFDAFRNHDGHNNNTYQPTLSASLNEMTENQNNDNVRGDSNSSSSSSKNFHNIESMNGSTSCHWGTFVIGCVLGIGCIVSGFTYVILNHIAKEAAEDSFQIFANNIEYNFKYHLSDMFAATRALSYSITADALATNQVFPYVALKSFEEHGYVARENGRLEILSFNPLVQNDDYNDWLDFSLSNYDWPVHAKEIADILDPTYQSRRSVEVVPNIPLGSIYEHELFRNGTMANVEWSPRHNDYLTGNDFAPTFYSSPAPLPQTYPYMNMNYYTNDDRRLLSEAAMEFNALAFSQLGLETKESIDMLLGAEVHASFHTKIHGRPFKAMSDTHCVLSVPVYKDLVSPDNTSRIDRDFIGGYVFAVMTWHSYMVKLLPDGVNGIVAVLQNSCGQSLTYRLQGSDVFFVSGEDFHDTRYDSQVRIVDILDLYEKPELIFEVEGHCTYLLKLYPSVEYEEMYQSSLPVVLAIVIASMFFVMIITLLVYDRVVYSRDRKNFGAAARSDAIVSSLFPKNVRDRLLAEKEAEAELVAKQAKKKNAPMKFKAGNLRSFLSHRANENNQTGLTMENQEPSFDNSSSSSSDDFNPADIYKSKPIADLFPETTILFGDIVGFTAWSSVREPTQVFTLLETVYHAFDDIARRRRVFKVETVGDCYVAVCGLPDKRKDHAVTMCRFAKDCMVRMWGLVKKLETTLGPDTSDLTMRMGLHSGPVTAGVLRGERSRFQLFGDTMNTAARMEHNGVRSKIQLSADTAKLLIDSGKSSWVALREDKIVAKGKGEMQTYWLLLGSEGDDTKSDGYSESIVSAEKESTRCLDVETDDNVGVPPTVESMKAKCSEKVLRMIGWNNEVLLRLLKQMMARRNAILSATADSPPDVNEDLIFQPSGDCMVLEEVKEIIELPQFDAKATRCQQDIDTIELDPRVPEQLEDYLMTIGAGYRDNPFHNFEHASHVTMSVVKLLSRIVAPSEHYTSNGVAPNKDDASSLHDHTYGITSDPLTQFSCVLSALIHDLDHPGVPNAQLIKEGAPLATYYCNKSVAEQNSVDMAWKFLMLPKYTELRAAIYANECEMKRFRQLVVNSVMATDIVDKELKALRNARWDKAFSQEEANQLHNVRDQINRKATIVIEHLIQASDVAHTMQHWHIYRKWNERFFMECYEAYVTGRSDSDPSINWYTGEIGFFDFYIIPLAKKLKDCGVFGVSSDEYLNYALKNRKEWEDRGQEIVNDMLEKVNKLY